MSARISWWKYSRRQNMGIKKRRKKKLCVAGIRYSLLYPARLSVTVDGTKFINKTPDEAFG